MDPNTFPTRRRFLTRAGAALSAPLVVAGAQASGGEMQGETGGDGETHSPLEARLRELEDLNAIRDLHRTYVRLVNRRSEGELGELGSLGNLGILFVEPSEAGFDESIRGLSGDGFGEGDVIELAPDRRSATGRFHCTVETETALGPTCTLVEMARAQGVGFLRRSRRCVIESVYVKRDGVWRIGRVAYAPGEA